MKTRTILKTLRELQPVVMDQFPNLNRGGCAVFACMIGRKLEAIGLEAEVVTPVDGWNPSAATIRQNVYDKWGCQDWDANGLCRSHLAVRFKTVSGVVYTYDSRELHRDSSVFGNLYGTDPEFGTGLTLEETEAMCANPEDWNMCFDRDDIPELQSLVDRFFPQQGEFKNV